MGALSSTQLVFQKVIKMNALTIALAIIVGMHVFLDIFLRTVWPKWLAPKPNIKYEADHYFISESQAGHDILIFNTGRGKARDIDFYVEFKAPFKVVGVVSNPPGDNESGGVNTSNWHSHWKTLAPKNFISIRIMSEAKKSNPLSVFPLETKVSDKDRIISRMYAPSRV